MNASRDQVPLCVDLDGTLVNTDTLHETLLLLLKTKPWKAALVPLWLGGGKAAFKRRLAAEVVPAADALPYRADFLAWLVEQRAQGRRLVLATASDSSTAEGVAAHTGLFEETFASDGKVNLGSEAKRDLLVARYGAKRFDYAGNGTADVPVFAAARRSVLVNASAGVRSAAEASGTVEKVFPRERRTLRAFAKAVRVRQWLKNLLVLVPLVTAHRFLDTARLLPALLAFVSISLCASAVYVVNDLMDLESDRRHREKRRRPFASGVLPVAWGVALAPVLFAASLLVAAFLPPPARVLLGTYLATTFAYTFYLKRKLLVDVFTLSFLYTLRVLFGSAASDLPASPWLLAFSIFVFLSLAFAKRASELANLRAQERAGASGRDYFVWDEVQINILGVASAYLSAVVLAIYIQSRDVQTLYRHPGWLWLIVPLLLYWLSRVWILVSRGAMNEDPIVFATRDRITFLVAALTAVVLLVATHGTMKVPGLLE